MIKSRQKSQYMRRLLGKCLSVHWFSVDIYRIAFSTTCRVIIIVGNVGKLLVGFLWTNFNKILIEIYMFLFKKVHLKMSSEKSTAILSRP